jgi:predicted alpha/beta hydrolase family esterase
MKVIFYHGYGSSKKSSKYVYLEKFCKEKGYELICDEVDHTSSETLSVHINRLKRETENSKEEIILVGHSLGGYYALYLARMFFLKCLLINPCLFEAARYTGTDLGIFSLDRVPTVILADMNDTELDINLVVEKMKTECEVVQVHGDGHLFNDNLDLIGHYVDDLRYTFSL